MRFRDVPAAMVRCLIRLYAYAVSPLMAGNCRFHPTCSCYADSAVERHGVLKGIALTARRLLRCHPWYKGAQIDPVPASIDWRDIIRYKPDHLETTKRQMERSLPEKE